MAVTVSAAMSLDSIGLFLMGLLPAGLLMGNFIWFLRCSRRKSKYPFTEGLLRPPGESLRLRIMDLEEVFLDLAMWWTLLGIGGLAAWVASWVSFSVYGILIGLFGIWSLWVWHRVRPKLKLLVDCKLGFEGERIVGMALSELMRDGYRVYHDMPFEGFNIDHVVVGRSGVFAVETKTRRKPIDGKKVEYRVTYDGQKLHFPWGSDDYGLQQVKNNAKSLSSLLASATGMPVFVSPVLVLPGWFVEVTGRNGPKVLNSKQCPQYFRSLPGDRLTDSQVQQIAHQIEQKCRMPV